MQPTTPLTPDQIATDYVASELAAARKTARRTRLFAGGAIVFVACYMTFLVATLHTRLFAPQPAAELLAHYATTTVDRQLESFANYIKDSGPEAISGLPDAVIDRLPVVRATLEEKLDAALREYSTELAAGLDDHLATFLAANQDGIHAFFALAKDPTFVAQFGEALETELLRVLEREVGPGRTVLDSVQDGLVALRELEFRLDRLAHSPHLNPHEQRLRQIIAITLKMTGDRV